MGKASRSKRQRSRQSSVQQALVDRVKQSLSDERVKVVKRSGGRKVSEILMEFAGPWLEAARNDGQRKAVIGMAVLAWNMAGFPEPERWDGMSPEFSKMLPEPAKAILMEMISRKLALYPEETRSIIDYEITGGGGKITVDVVSSLLPQEIEALKHGNQGI